MDYLNLLFKSHQTAFAVYPPYLAYEQDRLAWLSPTLDAELYYKIWLKISKPLRYLFSISLPLSHCPLKATHLPQYLPLVIFLRWLTCFST